jgi:hypothetical protein
MPREVFRVIKDGFGMGFNAECRGDPRSKSDYPRTAHIDRVPVSGVGARRAPDLRQGWPVYQAATAGKAQPLARLFSTLLKPAFAAAQSSPFGLAVRNFRNDRASFRAADRFESSGPDLPYCGALLPCEYFCQNLGSWLHGASALHWH